MKFLEKKYFVVYKEQIYDSILLYVRNKFIRVKNIDVLFLMKVKCQASEFLKLINILIMTRQPLITWKC